MVKVCNENEEERAKRGEEKRRKKITKRRLLKEDVRVLCLWRPLKFLVKGEIWRVTRIFLVKTPWMSLRAPDSRACVRMVPHVTDVLISPSSEVTEVCDISSSCSDWDYVEPQSFSFSKKRIWTTTQE